MIKIVKNKRNFLFWKITTGTYYVGTCDYKGCKFYDAAPGIKTDLALSLQSHYFDHFERKLYGTK